MRHRIDRCVTPLRDRLRPGSRVLDFGCGTGQITLALHQAGFDVCGFDTSLGMVGVARKLCGESKIQIVTGEAKAVSAIPFPDGSFGGIVASSVLEYARDPLAQLAELARVLELDGVLVMTVPNPLNGRRKLERPLRSAAGSFLGASILPLLNRKGKAYWEYLTFSLNHFPLRTWLDMLEQTGMRLDQASDDGLPLTLIVALKKL